MSEWSTRRFVNIMDVSGAGISQQASCPYCGCIPHPNIGQCPAIAKIEYYPDGSIKSVEKR